MRGEGPARLTIVDLTWLSLGIVVVGHVLYGVPRRAADALRITLHNGDDFADSDRGPRPDRLHGVRLLSAAGSRPVEVGGDPDSTVYVDVDATAAPAWLVVETPPTFIELGAPSFDRYLTHEGLADVLAARGPSAAATPGREIYSKHIKTAVHDHCAPLRFAAGAAGLPIEIVPLAAGPVVVGDTLRVQVLVGGQPVPGLQLRAQCRRADAAEVGDGLCLRSDAAGVVDVPLTTPGVWRLHTIAMTPHDDPAGADWRSRWASLSFVLQPAVTP